MSTHLQFKELQLRNFMSFGNSTVSVDLSPSESILVQGQNVDNNGANGAGKCVCADTPIKIRNKKTGAVLTMTIGEFYQMQRAGGRGNPSTN